MTASLALLTSAAQAETCWYPQEAKAAQLRDFHIMLMVGALQCKTSNPATVRDYNIFVNRQSLVLDTNKHLLRDHFVRDAGPNDADYAYDRYSTATANALQPKIGGDPDACARIDTLARVASVANLADLMVLAQAFESKQFANVCPASAYPVAEEAGPLPPAVAAGAPISMAQAADSAPPAGADLPPIGTPPAPTPVVAAAPVDPAPVQTASAAGTAQDPATMKAAITALQAAVAALQAAQGPASAATPVAAHSGASAVGKTSAVAKPELIAVKVQEAPIIPPQE